MSDDLRVVNGLTPQMGSSSIRPPHQIEAEGGEGGAGPGPEERQERREQEPEAVAAAPRRDSDAPSGDEIPSPLQAELDRQHLLHEDHIPDISQLRGQRYYTSSKDRQSP